MRFPIMAGHVAPPARSPLALRAMLGAVERRMGKPLLASRILAHYPKALLGAGIMEALVAHDDREVPRRLLKLLRMRVSFLSSCPFCIDLNSRDYRSAGISDDEVRALRGLYPIELSSTLSDAEKAALDYAAGMTSSPVSFTAEAVERLHRHFSDRAIVVIVSTVAQVNFWTRLVQGFGVPPAGFSGEAPILDLDAYRTIHEGDEGHGKRRAGA